MLPQAFGNRANDNVLLIRRIPFRLPFSPGEKGSRIQNPSPSGRGAGVRAEGHGKWIVIFMEYSTVRNMLLGYAKSSSKTVAFPGAKLHFWTGTRFS